MKFDLVSEPSAHRVKSDATKSPAPTAATHKRVTTASGPWRPAAQLWEIVSLAHLITESNIKAYVQPVVLFSMLSIASGGVTTGPSPSWGEMACAFPRAALYVWLYVFHFDCSNQKAPESIKEDKLNKPWRAIPSGRLSVEAAERWYVVASCLLVLASATWLGGLPEALAFMLETWVYDSASGAASWWAKNTINALFYATGQLGATRVAAESMTDTAMARAGFEWCALLGLTTLTTVQIQDMRDQEGDAARGRRTMPLALGDGPTRAITALLICFWSLACPAYWGNGAFTAGYVLPLLIGTFVAARTLACRSVKADRKTFHYYTLVWLPALYSIPLLSRYELVRFS
ncbi:UbiA prenyltransferase family-domain-containing protein [Diplogelasinospora grovesii]|uniref:UbiA prenyltransferase family-domain-containing protein n=1 Tax=Diplogelasinospora grovesii TaxID=303347 RepID=A0AAN6MVL3_9PEZI|nr:UbiA prenyltransferase family-domain-containing protein [Diplogelasinospora grovesii]